MAVPSPAKSKVSNSFLRLLECPVCFEYMSAPIFMCINGHNLCSLCKEEVKICPSCRGTFSNTRNIALQELAEQVLYPCDNAKNGCGEGILLAEKETHKKICPCRLYTCILGTVEPCAWQGRKDTYLSHIKSEHKGKLFASGNELPLSIIKITEDKVIVLAFHVYGELFWVIQRMTSDKFFNISVHYVGPQENCSKYMYEVEYCSKDKSHMLLFRSTTHPDFIDVKSVGDEKSCSTIHSDFMEHFRANNTLQCKVRILKNS